MICAFTDCNNEAENDVMIKIINEVGCFCDTHLKVMKEGNLIEKVIKPISMIVR
jgi:hypothetical protein